MNQFEKQLVSKIEDCTSDLLIAGVDEVGRGCLAGPLVVAAVILPNNYYNPAIKDSKLLSQSKRLAMYHEILLHAIDYKIIVQSVRGVEYYNPKRASIIGMEQAISQLRYKPNIVISDAEKLQLDPTIQQFNIIKGDQLSQTVGAASILAKVSRDAIMEGLDQFFPEYHWRANKGYGTAEHLQALATHGISEHHRTTYAPVKKYVNFK